MPTLCELPECLFRRKTILHLKFNGLAHSTCLMINIRVSAAELINCYASRLSI